MYDVWEIAVREHASRLDSSPTSLATVFLDRNQVRTYYTEIFFPNPSDMKGCRPFFIDTIITILCPSVDLLASIAESISLIFHSSVMRRLLPARNIVSDD